MTHTPVLLAPNHAPYLCAIQPRAGSCEEIREGKAPTEPVGVKLLIQNRAAASPSQCDTIGFFPRSCSVRLFLNWCKPKQKVNV